MDTTQTTPLVSPERFADWVQRVAAINEEFSETLRDSADIIAEFDPVAASGLYQAADVTSVTVQQLRLSAPTPEPVKKPKAARALWFLLGMIAVYIIHG